MQQNKAMTQHVTDRPSVAVIHRYHPTRGLARFVDAFADVRSGLAQSRLAMTLGWLDIKMRYRGSLLGPFWLTISTAVMVTALGLLYAELFHISVKEYLPFLSFSLVLWTFVGSVWGEGASVFVDNSGLILSSNVPFFVYVYRAVVRNLIVLAHNALVIAVVFFIFDVTPRFYLTIASALGVWIIDSFAVMMLLGVLGARFRDVGPLIVSAIQIMFFITPVIWKPELAHSMKPWLIYNPFYPLIEILRAPAMGHAVSAGIWRAALIHSTILTALAAVVFSRFRKRLAYWV